MGSYAIIVKTEEIRKKVQEGDLLSAQEVLDTIELKKVKNLSDLNLMASVFKENGRYDEAEEIYYRIYQKLKTRKTIAQLIDISIKRDDVAEAERYYELYEKYKQEDFESHIFRYKIDKLKGATYEQLIQSLEKLKKLEYSEKWAYELAKLYYKAGMEEDCIKECSDIILWFCDGIYVEKAKLLRSYFINGTSKEKIMEELKRRAGAIQEKTQDETPVAEQVQTVSEQIHQEEADQLYEEVAVALEAVFLREDDSDKNDSKADELVVNHEEEFVEVGEEELILEQQEEIKASGEEEVALARDEQVFVIDLEEESEEDSIFCYIEESTGVNPESVFGDFFTKETAKLQILEGLANLLREDLKPVITVVISNNQEVRNDLSKAFALFMNKANFLSSPKIAKITSKKLNALKLSTKRDVLKGCCLVVENADELSQTAIFNLIEFSKQMKEDFAVILTKDNQEDKTLVDQYPILQDVCLSIVRLLD